MDSGRFYGDDHLHQQLNEQVKPPEKCWCKGVSNLGELKWLQDFMVHQFKPSIGEEVEKVLDRKLVPILSLLQQCVLLLNPSSLPFHAESSASRILQLQFNGDVPDTLLTMDKIEDEGASLEVELVDESGNKVEVGAESCVKIKIDVLDDELDTEDRDDSDELTAEDYTKHIVRPRKNKGALLKGNCEIRMTRGAASVSHIAFTDNSKSMRNGNFRLGAKVVRGLPPGVVVKEAVSNAFTVKERRQKCAKKHEFPSIDDDLWRLVYIRKDGPVYKRAVEAGIRTVNDFLQRCETTTAKELQHILHVPEAKWKAIVENANKAKACNLTQEPRVKFMGQTNWVDDSRKELADKTAAYPKQSLLLKFNSPANQILDQELINPSFIQGHEQPPPPPPCGNSIIGELLHTLNAGSLLSNQMGSIPPNIDHDATPANQAYQGKMVEHENDLPLEASWEDINLDWLIDLKGSPPRLEEMGNVSQVSSHVNVTSKIITACYVTKAAALFMISVQQDASVPAKKRKLQ
ncbi:calmodulin-binding protein 60 C-like isoform X1 [Spinacia oleracea]|uniref:Calmodulin-binding protein 60 C-like isoform X1 n=1 Tax=Spinacia oleracea TaxID=3562 RepID=A0A9R0K135_SPIOL|nr:calmodulin-binding protein 60 C-like isoform X1 [Spinacia oleracea]